MKLNWGTGIALVYGAFALVMVAFVFQSRRYDPGLVRKDYYNLDLNYQEHMEKKQNTANLTHGLNVRFDAVRRVIRLQFPETTDAPSGSIKCFRPVNVRDDMNLDVQTGPDGAMEIPAGRMSNGLWHLEVDWQAGGTKYFHEATLTLTNA